MSVDDRLQEILERLGRTLGNALSSSEAAAEAVETARREGVSLYLRLEPREGDGARGIRLVPAEDPQSEGDRSPRDESTRSESRTSARLRRARLRAQTQRAAYRLDQSDVEFLRQLGIDPSRTGRSKSGRGRT